MYGNASEKKFFDQNSVFNIFYLGVTIKKLNISSHISDIHILIQKITEQLRKMIFFSGTKAWPLKN